jgi:hypothetical protein
MKPDTFKGVRFFCFLVWGMLFHKQESVIVLQAQAAPMRLLSGRDQSGI